MTDLVEVLALHMVLTIEDGVGKDEPSADIARHCAQTALAALESAGYKVVGRDDVTPEMIKAGNDAYFSVGGVFPSVEEHDEAMKMAYAAMLDAAPKIGR